MKTIVVLLSLLQAVCYGTSIVVVVSDTGDYVVIAADSRNAARGKAKANDDACKVIALDDTLFYNSGSVLIGVHKGQYWDSLKVARDAYRASKNHDAEALSIAWGNAALTWFYRQGALGMNLQSVATEDGLVTGGFVTFDSQRNPASFYQSLFFHADTRQLSRQPNSVSKGKIGISGVRLDLLREFEKAETVRARNAYGGLPLYKVTKDLSYDIQFAKKAVQFVIDNVDGEDKEYVHGPVDVVVIRRFGGIEWVSRKPSCYSMDFQSPKPPRR